MFRRNPESAPISTERAERFVVQHIAAPRDYDTYFEKMVADWQQRRESAASNESPKGFWLRNNAVPYTSHGVHIDYMTERNGALGSIGAIDIDNEGPISEIQVWVAKEDGSHEPVPAYTQAYSLPALEQAISYVEELALRSQE